MGPDEGLDDGRKVGGNDGAKDGLIERPKEGPEEGELVRRLSEGVAVEGCGLGTIDGTEGIAESEEDGQLDGAKDTV